MNTEQTYHTPNVVQQRREEAAAINAAMNPAPALPAGVGINPAPYAGKLSDEQLGEIGATAAAHWFNENGQEDQRLMYVSETGPYAHSDTPARTAFAAAVREAVEKEQAEEIARLTAKSEEMCQAFVAEAAKKHEALAIIEQAIDMVNTPGTTKDNLPKAINAKIMQRAAAHDATLKKLDAAKAEIQRLKAEYASLLQAYKKLEVTEQRTRDAYDRAMTDCVTLREENNALTAELAKANAELERLRWRSVEVKPTREDADNDGNIILTNGDIYLKIGWNNIKGIHSSWKWWSPFCPPPAPSAEEVERERFEIWAATSSFGHDLTRMPCGKYYNSVLTSEAWELWQAARAAKEGEK